MEHTNLPTPESLWNVMSFLSFGLSIVAAVLAIDMYKLSRTGQFGASWRVLIIASVIYALLQVSHLGAQTVADFNSFSRLVELVFVLALTYSFYLQRRNFLNISHLRDKDVYRGHERGDERAPYGGPERRGDERASYTGPERRASRHRREREVVPADDSEQMQTADIEWHETETTR
jgi:hypothetical protein